MTFERSDEARREDSLYDRIGQVERINRRKDEEMVELNKKIKNLETENAELKAENADLKEWRKRYDAGAAERRWKALGGSW